MVVLFICTLVYHITILKTYYNGLKMNLYLHNNYTLILFSHAL